MTAKHQPAYPIVVVRTRGQRPKHLDDPAFQTRAISLASTGISRYGVACLLGVSHTALYQWLERGLAEPEKTPWGPFAEAFMRAERALEGTGATATAIRMRSILAIQQMYLRWLEDGATGDPPPCPSTADFEWVLRVMAARYPAEHGTSSHRRPEQEPSGEAWLERNTMTHEQLTTMLRDPPEQVAMALLAAGYVRTETKT